MLVKFVTEKKELWEDYLDTCVFAYNTSKHESSKYCPFSVMFGRQALLPVQIQSPKEEDTAQHFNDNDEVIEQHFMHQTKVAQIVKENILTAQKHQKQTYDRKHYDPATCKVGTLVLRKDIKRKKRAGGKMDFKWQGPYKVVKSVGKGIFLILNTSDLKSPWYTFKIVLPTQESIYMYIQYTDVCICFVIVGNWLYLHTS